jgi:hypothetical protein
MRISCYRWEFVAYSYCFNVLEFLATLFCCILKKMLQGCCNCTKKLWRGMVGILQELDDLDLMFYEDQTGGGGSKGLIPGGRSAMP